MIRKVLGFLSCAVIVGLGLGPHPALAGIVTQTYSDVTSWSNAVAVGADATFTDPKAPVGGDDPFNSAGGYTEDGIKFVGDDGAGYALQIDNPSATQPWLNWGGGELLQATYSSGSINPDIRVTLPAGMTAFGVNLMTTGFVGETFKITLSDGESFTAPTFANPTAAFFGLTATSPITYIDFTLTGAPAGSSMLMDNFEIGTVAAAPTPESASFVLIGSGLIALTILRRRSKLGRT